MKLKFEITPTNRGCQIKEDLAARATSYLYLYIGTYICILYIYVYKLSLAKEDKLMRIIEFTFHLIFNWQSNLRSN